MKYQLLVELDGRYVCTKNDSKTSRNNPVKFITVVVTRSILFIPWREQQVGGLPFIAGIAGTPTSLKIMPAARRT
jgi:hypothetical protein